MQLIAIFGPTGVGKTDVALALARRLRAKGEQPVAVSADALQVYAGLEILTGVASAAQQRELEHRLVSFLPVSETFSAGRYAQLAHAEIDALLADGRRPLLIGGTGLYLRAALTTLSLRPPPPRGLRERVAAELERCGSAALHAELAQAAPWAADEIERGDRQRVARAIELLRAGQLHKREGDSELWTEQTRRPTLLVGLTMQREALYERIDARVDAMLADGAREEVLRADAQGASATARKALGFSELLQGDVEAMKRRSRNYARRQLTWMRKLAGVTTIDVSAHTPEEVAREILALVADHEPAQAAKGTGVDVEGTGARGFLLDSPPSMRFEKWQALGNDYIVVERDELRLTLTPARIRRICDPHLGVGSDGILLLSRSEDPQLVAKLEIYNPDGSRAELSGNGAREAILYLRHRGWTDSDSFSIETDAGPVSPTITGPDTCTVDMGRASLQSKDFPSGQADGRAEIEVGGVKLGFQHVSIGNPQCAIEVEDLKALEALDLPAIGPAIEADPRFPNRSNVSFYVPLAPDRIRARIFERGVGETLSSGTGASGAAIAHVLAGGSSPVTVLLDGGELTVEVADDLQINLTGWARPVYAGSLSDEFIEELHATE
ncbi:MAG TPA: diaminopimelate epimerase [Solirubrobacteraceae bacterium]|jgi:diaminopimelate epimerase/tRNA dimethylallyltransferase